MAADIVTLYYNAFRKEVSEQKPISQALKKIQISVTKDWQHTQHCSETQLYHMVTSPL